MHQPINRRGFLGLLATVAAGTATRTWAQEGSEGPKQVLFFTRSAGFQHSVVKRKNNNDEAQLSHAESILAAVAKPHGIAVTCTKDGGYFTADRLAPFSAVVFYTSGDLMAAGKDGTPPMPAGGKDALLRFVEAGKGFVGLHCASDTFHGKDNVVDPYLAMLGGEFDGHNAQQKSRIRAVGGFAPLKEQGDFDLHEEWYRFKHLAPDLHVIHVQETATMREQVYKDRKPYPATWARLHGKGRVFYTGMAHREDTWEGKLFQQTLLAGLLWATRLVDADVPPNLKTACPDAEKVRGA